MKKAIYHVFVDGIPIAQPRPRKGKHGNFYNPDLATAWKEAIQICFMQKKRMPTITGPVYLTIHFYFQKKGLNTTIPHTSKPDKDNLEKVVMDALTGIGVWNDDSQVYGGRTAKFWTDDKSGAEIWVEEIV